MNWRTGMDARAGGGVRLRLGGPGVSGQSSVIGHQSSISGDRSGGCGWGRAEGLAAEAFTLLEVMIAMAIFFVALFAILGLVSQNLRVARGLKLGEVDFSTVAAEIALTNKIEEGVMSGDFGDGYPGASWTTEVSLYSSNGLYQVDIAIAWPGNGVAKSQQTTILLYRPDSVLRSSVIRQ